MTSRLHVVYIRRSMKREGDADVSDETQEAVARSRLPADAMAEVIRDSGGHCSGYTDQRPGYQRLLELVRSGAVAGIAAYDDSRLNRNAENALGLHRECLLRGVSLYTSSTPAGALFESGGKLNYSIQAVVAEFYRNQQSERMKAMFAQTFAVGGHRGQDPFGYATARDHLRRVVHPRRLEIVPEEADVVRQVFAELAEMPFSEISDRFNAGGVLRPRSGPWTADAVKAIWDRRWVYLGFVVRGRGHDDRHAGQHEPIITEEEFRAALAAVEARKRGRGKAPRSSRRVYLLRGLAFCSCGSRMRGDARVRNGREYRYYACPVSDGRGRWLGPTGEELSCQERRIRAEVAEADVLYAVRALVLPAAVIDLAREELARRLALAPPDLTESQRRTLKVRLENLRKQHEWGDIDDPEYRAAREALERQLMLLPDPDKVVGLDQRRKVLVSMAENLERATPLQRRAIVELLVERVTIADRSVRATLWAEAARAFLPGAPAHQESPADHRPSAG